MSREPEAATADVCLLLEGTYPFVPGGVSSWVHQIVSSMPDVRFAVVHVSPTPGHYRERVFEVPDNVIDVSETFLTRPRPRRLGRPPRQLVRAFCTFANVNVLSRMINAPWRMRMLRSVTM